MYVFQELERMAPGRFAVVASTGIAGLHIGDGTTHAFAGVGLARARWTRSCTKLASDAAVARWRAHNFLVVDEVSMLTAFLVDALDAVARVARGVARPFGGVRLVFFGDFLQLPPVGLGGGGGSADFAFRARAWDNARIETCVCFVRALRGSRPPMTAQMHVRPRTGRGT